MEHEYKFHTVLITCWPSLEPFGFAPQIRIANNDLGVVKTFNIELRGFTPDQRRKLTPFTLPKTGSTVMTNLVLQKHREKG